MLIKTARRGVPAVISRSAPTSLAVELARELNITLVGFARGQKMNIYTNFPSIDF
jgi:FdhD protein